MQAMLPLQETKFGQQPECLEESSVSNEIAALCDMHLDLADLIV